MAQRSRPRPRPAPTRREPARTTGARWALVAFGAWSIAPPYVGPPLGFELDVSANVEAADHLIPGLLVVALGVAGLRLVATGREDTVAAFLATAGCVLAGLWETTSHVPLVLDGGEPGSPWGAVAFHAWPGPVVLLLSLWILLQPPAR